MGKISFKKIAVGSFVAFVVFIACVFCISIFYPEEKDLGGGFSYFNSFIDYWASGDTTNIFIPPTVSSYINTNDYILARQKPDQFDNVIYERSYNYPFGRDSTYFWFVDKNSKSLTGPLHLPEMHSFLKEKNLDYLLEGFH